MHLDKSTKQEIVREIRANHLKANIGWIEDQGANPKHPHTGCRITIHWSRAWVDPGGTIFGPGPYLHVPISGYWGYPQKSEETVHRVYPPARLRKRLSRLLQERDTA